MDIKPYDKTIRDLLGSKRQFLIPRFQREYSWDKKNYCEFFEDMIGNLTVSNGKIVSNQYFLGTMLFIGNFTEGTDQEISVVDGQQRLTTITILFSAISDRFSVLGEEKLSRQLFGYIMAEDDDGNEVRILKSKTSYPFFSYFIQDKEKSVKQDAITEEEICIKDTYEYFVSQLKGDNLKKLLKRKNGSDDVDTLCEVDILKAMRDQVLNSTFVAISTTDRTQANRIFEILNAKGKKLADIDLIKNKLFEILKKEEPADFAEESWKKIKTILNSGRESVGFATFYRHYWISTHKLTYSNKLYDSFNSTITKSETSYRSFLDDLVYNAKIYMQIVNPKREDYHNRKEYYWLVQSLNILNNYFNVVQVRVALLALLDLKQRNIIDLAILKDAVLYLENFHFAYNAILSGRANRPEKVYSSFAIALRKCTNKAEARTVIKTKLYDPLRAMLPSYRTFSQQFFKLTYTKADNPINVKTKYAINKLNQYFEKSELLPDDGSVEHIYPESNGDLALNIGNLILLEININKDADNLPYKDKIAFYENSKYTWVHKFIQEHDSWDPSMISDRAIELAKIYYEKILGEKIEESQLATV